MSEASDALFAAGIGTALADEPAPDLERKAS